MVPSPPPPPPLRKILDPPLMELHDPPCMKLLGHKLSLSPSLELLLSFHFCISAFSHTIKRKGNVTLNCDRSWELEFVFSSRNTGNVHHLLKAQTCTFDFTALKILKLTRSAKTSKALMHTVNSCLISMLGNGFSFFTDQNHCKS